MRTIMKSFAILLLFFVLVLQFSCKDKITDPSQPSNDFKGIINDETGNAISGVSVYIIYDGSTLMKSLITQSDTLSFELSSFSLAAQGRTVVLNWSTKTEKNSDRFEVERSLVPITVWTKIASIKASVLSNSPKSYSYSDMNLEPDKYQYRLKMIDNNGAFTYSNVESVELAGPKVFAVSQNYPNPFSNNTNIMYTIPEDSKISLKILDFKKSTIKRTFIDDFILYTFQHSAGDYNLIFNDTSKIQLANGIYYIQCIKQSLSTGKTDTLERIMYKLESDPTQLASTEANAVSLSNGKFKILYDNFYINAEYVRTGPDSPELLGTYKITNSPTIVLIKSGYQPLVKKITIDNSGNTEESFVLTKIK
jgi:hypothetical protein